MNKALFIKTIAIMQDYYKQNADDFSESDYNLYFSMLKSKCSDKIFSLAVKEYMTHERFFPVPFVPNIMPYIQKFAEKTNKKTGVSKYEAFPAVLTAIRKFGYNQYDKAMEWLEKHDPILKQVADRWGWLRLCNMEISEIKWVEKDFMERFEYAKKENSNLPHKEITNMQDKNAISYEEFLENERKRAFDYGEDV